MKLLPFLSAAVQFRFLPRPLLPGCWDWKAGFWLVLKEKLLPSDCFLRGPVKIWRKTSDPRKGPSCPHSSFAFAGVVSASRRTASFSLQPLSTADSASGALRCGLQHRRQKGVLLLKQHHRGPPVNRAHNTQSLKELRSGGTHCVRCLYSVFPSLFQRLRGIAHCGHQERLSFLKTLPSFGQLYLEASLQNHGHSCQELFQHHGQIASWITGSAGFHSPRPFQNTVEAELGLKLGLSPLKIHTGNKQIHFKITGGGYSKGTRNHSSQDLVTIF